MKSILLISLVLILIGNTSMAQFSYDNLLEKKKYAKIHNKVKKQYKNNSEDVSANYDYSVLFSIIEYKLFNTDSSYNYIKKAERLYFSSDKKEKLNKNKLNNESINNQVLLVCQLAFNKSVNDNTIENYNYFINKYTDNKQLIAEAVSKRNNLAFEIAKDINTILSFQNFIDTYPNSQEIAQAKKTRNSLAFTSANKINTIESFQQFIDTYPSAEEVSQAILLRDQLAFNEAFSKKTSKALKDFLSKYPDSKLYSKAIYEKDRYIYIENTINDNIISHINFINDNPNNKYKESITDSLFYISKRQENLHGMQYLIENYDYSNLSDSIWYYYYKVFTKDGYPKTYSTFKGLYENDFPFLDLLNKEYEISLLTDELKLDKGYQKQFDKKYKDYIRQASDKYLAFQVLQIIIKPYLDNKNWKEALGVVESYKPIFGNQNNYINDLFELLKFSDRNIKSNNIGNKVNSKNGGEYVPVTTADNKYLYFCGSNRTDNYSGEDIFVSKNINGVWQKPVLVNDLCTFGNDAPLSISTDGNRMIIFKNGDLYFSDQTYYGWSKIEKFPSSINSEEWDADAMITSDGNALLFSSQRKDINKGTGVDLLQSNNIDIYVSVKTDDGWSNPINLGSKINTRYTDRQPYLHSDMKTLYFSSDGHGGLGSLDVFKITRLSDTSWTEWSEPINLGKEINTANSDWGYKISTDGNLAYFAAGYDGDNDIYTVELPLYLRPGFVATISGKLIDKNNKPIESTIKWEDLSTGKVVGESKSNPKDGSFFIVLPLGKVYGYFIDKDEYYPISNNIDLRTENKPIELVNNIEIVTFKKMIEDGIAVPINNLFFPISKDNLLPESMSELKRVAEIIMANTLKVEISGHTDNTGNDEYNQELSEKRAKAVCDYLISIGVPTDLMIIIGYGSKKPVSDNDTEEGQAKNRRVELKFIN